MRSSEMLSGDTVKTLLQESGFSELELAVTWSRCADMQELRLLGRRLVADIADVHITRLGISHGLSGPLSGPAAFRQAQPPAPSGSSGVYKSTCQSRSMLTAKSLT